MGEPLAPDERPPAGALVRPKSAELAWQVLGWQRELERLGVRLPAAVVHDFGLVLAVPEQQWSLAPEAENDAYAALLADVSTSWTAKRVRGLALDDRGVATVLARLLGRALATVAGADPAQQLLRERAYVLTALETLDLATLELCARLGGPSSALDVVDTLAALAAPNAHDVAEFSLQILPSVLDAKRRPSAVSTASDGYAGLTRRGTLDALLASELVWSDEELARRLADGELLFHARERTVEERRRLHHLVIDASASMRGNRSTFARGIAITTAKKLLAMGEDVLLRFFDSRLYEAHAARGGKLPLAHTLAFQSERGRHPTRVFRELELALELAMRREPRQHLITLYTHGALYVERELVARIRRHAELAAVFIVPNARTLHLDYLDLLSRHWIIDDSSLENPVERAKIATRILEDDHAGPVR
jgi:hypothetical protein